MELIQNYYNNLIRFGIINSKPN